MRLETLRRLSSSAALRFLYLGRRLAVLRMLISVGCTHQRQVCLGYLQLLYILG